MAEDRYPLEFPPGLFHNGTKGQAKGRWYDGNGIRFSQGAVGPIGGYVQHTITGGAIRGRPHAALIHPDGGFFVGTNRGLFVATTTRTPTSVSTAWTDITPAAISSLSTNLVWKLEAFGTLMIATCRGAGTYQLDTANVTPLAVPALGSNAHPIAAFNVLTTPERFLVLFGGTDAMQLPSNPFSQRRVYWASQQTTDTWIASDTNSAGFEDLDTKGNIVGGLNTPGKVLIFTTADLWSMTWIGGVFVFSFKKIAEQCGAISANAAAFVNSRTYWMGNGQFFVFDGYVRTLECEVADKVFGDMSATIAGGDGQSALGVLCIPNPLFNEITWYYPSSAAVDNDRYVTYNYLEGHWTYGQLSRTAGTVLPSFPGRPVLLDAFGNIYDHEMGSSRPGMNAFLESGPAMIGNGKQVATVQKVYPDDKTVGDVRGTLFASFEPDDPETSQTVSLTSDTDVRLSGRQFRWRIDEVAQTQWRVGIVQLGAVIGGLR